MIRINISQAKAHLSKYLAKLKEGEAIVLCKGDVPIAEIRPIRPDVRQPRPIGLDKGRLIVPESFLDPLPGELLDGFEGKNSI